MVWAWVWKISHKNVNFSLWVGSKSTRVKEALASYLLRAKRYARFRSWPISRKRALQGREGATCPEGLGRGKHALGWLGLVWFGYVMLEIPQC